MLNFLLQFSSGLITEQNNLQSLTSVKLAISVFICTFGLIGNIWSIFIILVLKEYKKSVLHMLVISYFV